ncbi:hydrolase 1, exosortase A system-associated [Aurantiacibacter luteus]|uniref:AB hydrolase-1 domain-containing protein n=1 Tax=Aurantiacibacter luteus TaxID=1581420 RepID=A0A0G9MX90_9SPHN|nr:hydrolase 1, exosortase A system-associated [Aurantiacibacter luteus]KLE35407.1 hypothetical protein AAW00_02935 [Aurantiacibacter luteus]
MTRRHLTLACEGDMLFGTIDEADGPSGLLIVSGGNEIRSGAFAGQAALAARVADAGYPVFRFDRRGVGDSEGENRGFRHSGADIRAAALAFRAECPGMRRLVALGNCDAASALIVSGGPMCDALIASNPWTLDEHDVEEEHEAALPPAGAIRARYLAKLRQPAELARLLRGGVDLRKLAKGLKGAAASAPSPSGLARELAQCLDASGKHSTILLAENDRTAQAFAASVDVRQFDVRRCPGASHAFVEPHAREWLEAQVLEVLAR